MRSSSLLMINVVSVLFISLISSCGKSPRQYANEWCNLNEQIIATEGEQKEKLIQQAKDLENEIYEAFKHDESSLDEIADLTDECD